MIKIGTEKLFTQTELLENLAAYLGSGYCHYNTDDIENGAGNFEISAVAATIGESTNFVRGFVTSRREG